MVSPWLAGALQGLEKGLAARELQKQKEQANALKALQLKATLDTAKAKRDEAAAKLAHKKLLSETIKKLHTLPDPIEFGKQREQTTKTGMTSDAYKFGTIVPESGEDEKQAKEIIKDKASQIGELSQKAVEQRRKTLLSNLAQLEPKEYIKSLYKKKDVPTPLKGFSTSLVPFLKRVRGKGGVDPYSPVTEEQIKKAQDLKTFEKTQAKVKEQKAINEDKIKTIMGLENPVTRKNYTRAEATKVVTGVEQMERLAKDKKKAHDLARLKYVLASRKFDYKKNRDKFVDLTRIYTKDVLTNLSIISEDEFWDPKVAYRPSASDLRLAKKMINNDALTQKVKINSAKRKAIIEAEINARVTHLKITKKEASDLYFRTESIVLDPVNGDLLKWNKATSEYEVLKVAGMNSKNPSTQRKILKEMINSEPKKPISTKTDVENATQTMGEGDNGSISTSIKAVKGLQLYTKKGISVFGFETAIRQKVGRLLAQFAPGALNTAVAINRSRYSLLDFYLLKMISLNSRRASMTGARTVEAMTSIANYEKKILKFMEDLKPDKWISSPTAARAALINVKEFIKTEKFIAEKEARTGSRRIKGDAQSKLINLEVMDKLIGDPYSIEIKEGQKPGSIRDLFIGIGSQLFGVTWNQTTGSVAQLGIHEGNVMELNANSNSWKFLRKATERDKKNLKNIQDINPLGK